MAAEDLLASTIRLGSARHKQGTAR